MEICDLSALELVSALRRRELSAVGALDAVLERAQTLASTVNPFTMILDERARAAATDADAALARGEGGPLCGVPVSTKDSHWQAGVESTSGSRSRLGHVPTRTVGAIRRLEAAGAVNFARTAVPELCYFGVTESELFGRTANPWDLARTAGGSSGGAAAAVAAGCGPLSLGGDGGGSIRIPAAFCGVVGFKPTHGAICHEPSAPEWKSLVALGPLAATVADARFLFDALAGADAFDRYAVDVEAAPPWATAGAAQWRMAVSVDLGFAPVDDGVRRAFERTVTALGAAGVELVEATPGLGSSIEAWSAIALAEAYVAEGDRLAAHPQAYGRAAAEFIRAGETISLPRYVRAQFAREEIHAAYADLFERTGARVLVTPALGCEAFEHGPGHPASIGGVPIGFPDFDWAPFLYDANLAGLPACSVPVGLGAQGLPVAVQVLGRRRDDRAVLAAAEVVESVMGRLRRPGLVATNRE